MSTIIVGAIVLLVFAWAVYYVIKKGIGCGGCCGKCECSCKRNLVKDKKNNGEKEI